MELWALFDELYLDHPASVISVVMALWLLFKASLLTVRGRWKWLAGVLGFVAVASVYPLSWPNSHWVEAWELLVLITIVGLRRYIPTFLLSGKSEEDEARSFATYVVCVIVAVGVIMVNRKVATFIHRMSKDLL